VDAKKGRINITFRKALVRGGTDNYYQYNVGTGSLFRWNAGLEKMHPCEKVEAEAGAGAEPSKEGPVVKSEAPAHR
jgi:hypothetical protein